MQPFAFKKKKLHKASKQSAINEHIYSKDKNEKKNQEWNTAKYKCID